jgi:hypothetical protein
MVKNVRLLQNVSLKLQSDLRVAEKLISMIPHRWSISKVAIEFRCLNTLREKEEVYRKLVGFFLN